jgi:predicted GNAT family acetyltransferase
MSDTARITDNPEASRLEVTIDGHVAELIYRRRADRLVLVHTRVPDALEGRGLGGQLVTAALSWAATEDLTVVPICPFARSWLTGHPDAAGTVKIDWP